MTVRGGSAAPPAGGVWPAGVMPTGAGTGRRPRVPGGPWRTRWPVLAGVFLLAALAGGSFALLCQGLAAYTRLVAAQDAATYRALAEGWPKPPAVTPLSPLWTMWFAPERMAVPPGEELPGGGVPPGLRPGTPLGREGIRARLAIVIDDWGYDWQAAERLLKLDAPITVAILPFLPYSREQALRARSRGFEVLVHLPMEPDDPSVSPGPGAVTTQMNDVEVREAVRRAIEAVPGAVGVNNHMGSRATADPRVMRQVLAEVARHGMFYVDSATSPHSVGAAVASAMGVPWARNQLFLDGEPSVQAVRSRLQLAMQRALRTGAAVAIGHVRPATAAALESMLPQLRREGVLLVPVSALLHR